MRQVSIIRITTLEPPPPPPGPVIVPHQFHHDGGVTGGVTGGTTTGAEVTEAEQELVHPEFVTAIVYVVVTFDGGINASVPDDHKMVFPGLRVHESAHVIDQVIATAFPFTTLAGLMAIVQVGGVTGGGGTTTTGAAVTLATQELVPAEFVTVRVYGVTAFDGGIICIEPDDPRIVFPGLSVPVNAHIIDHVSVVPLPFTTLAGLIEIVQDGGVTMILADNNAKYEK